MAGVHTLYLPIRGERVHAWLRRWIRPLPYFVYRCCATPRPGCPGHALSMFLVGVDTTIVNVGVPENHFKNASIKRP